MKNDNKKVSKFLSYVLRHDPNSIDLKLDENGWAKINDLIDCAAIDGKKLNRVMLEEVVKTNDKQRFSISENGQLIRANQGHSIKIDLALEPIKPPNKLYHGTAVRFLDAIFKEGLKPRNRHHVHLSRDIETALKVGQRHGKPVILMIDAETMSAEGHLFYCSANGVWLSDFVSPQYFSVINKPD